MKLQGFTLSDVEITANEVTYDLHNNFNFTGLSYEIESQTLKLAWHRSTGDWVPSETPCSIELRMQGVSHLSAKPRDLTRPFTEDDCLGTVVVVAAEKPSEESYGSIGHDLDDSMHLVFEFMSGFALRVQAETAMCLVAQTLST